MENKSRIDCNLDLYYEKKVIMISSWFILLFALIQGILEWLPVSSQGQTVSLLVYITKLEPQLALEISIWLHLGTLIAVLVKYRKEILQYLNYKNREESVIQWRWFLFYSTLGTVITGVPCFFLVRYFIASPSIGEYVMLVIGLALIFTAFLLYYSKKQKRTGKKIEELNKLQMASSGLLQGFSIIPGISRSGITMSGLLLMSTNKEDTVKGSFLMSIPAVLGGFILNIIVVAIEGGNIFPIEWWLLLIAVLLTAIIGYLTMELFIFIARKYNFALICMVLGIITLVLFSLKFITIP